MIYRTWRGATASTDADRYLAYLHETGLDERYLVEYDREVKHYEVAHGPDV